MKRPIAVFDSGLGGLSVVRHLREQLPAESIVYFGDTARVPYGTKSQRTVAHFALETARFLLNFEPKLIVAACNSASALALDHLIEHLDVPVIGVIEPGAAAAVQLAHESPIAILGTEATIASGAYLRAIHAQQPAARAIPRACPLFVPLVEEGRTCDDPIVLAACHDYLDPLRSDGVGVAVLGCTHYPLLRDAIAAVLGPAVHIIDSGEETTRAVRAALAAENALAPGGLTGELRCHVSDNPERFQRVGSRFLNHPIDSVEFVPPERYVTMPQLQP